MDYEYVENGPFGDVRTASCASTPLCTLVRLSKAGGEAVRASLLRNSSFPWADELAQHELENSSATWVIRQAIAGSVRVSEVTLRRVASGGEWFVMIALANNPRCPKDILEVCAADQRVSFKEITAIARSRLLSGLAL